MKTETYEDIPIQMNTYEDPLVIMDNDYLDQLLSLDNCDITLLAYLQETKLLPTNKNCATCENKCSIRLAVNKFSFSCRRSLQGRRCNFALSLNVNSWFSRTNLTYCQILSIVYYFVTSKTVTDASALLGIAPTTLIDWYKFCREVCIQSVFDIEIRRIGGPGEVVEIDERKFGRGKYNRDTCVEGQWVFGGIQRGSSNCFFVPVEKRDKATLLAIIKDNILPGTTIISESKKAYECLQDEGFKHITVNHNVTILDPTNDAHTNTIESQWLDIKRSLPFSGTPMQYFNGYLAAFIWKRQHDKKRLFHAFIEEIAKLYPL